MNNSGRATVYVKNDRYYNNEHDSPENVLFHTVPALLRSWITSGWRKPCCPDRWLSAPEIVQRSQALRVTWIGHSTFLIQMNNVTILTDPIFSQVSPFFPRMVPPGIAFDNLPPIDVVLISHNHWDHAHSATLRALAARNANTMVLAPIGDRRWLAPLGFKNIVEHDWWHSTAMAEHGLTFTFLPAHHWSARGLFDTNKSLWGSWMTVGTQQVYFAGDSAYTTHYAQIGNEFDIDLALMPIAPCAPHPHMRRSHMDATQALQAGADLKATTFIPMHWGTFGFGLDYYEGPLSLLAQAHQPDRHPQVHVLKVGQHWQAAQ